MAIYYILIFEFMYEWLNKFSLYFKAQMVNSFEECVIFLQKVRLN